MSRLVSVVVPVYNRSGYVRAALDSLRAQTYVDWEAMVVDDGSTDGSGDIVRDVAAQDERVRLHRQENQGAAEARNAGVERATGEFVAFLDSDDAWLPEKLERQLDAWREGVLYSDAYLVAPDGTTDGRIGDHVELARGQVFDRLLMWNVVATTTVLLSRELLEAAGPFDAALEPCEDYDLWLRLAGAGVPFDYVDEPLAYHRLHEGQLSSDAGVNATAWLKAVEKCAARSSGARRQQLDRRVASLRRYAAGALRQDAWRNARAGELDVARAQLREAHETAPTRVGGIVTAVATRSDAALRMLARRRLARGNGRT